MEGVTEQGPCLGQHVPVEITCSADPRHRGLGGYLGNAGGTVTCRDADRGTPTSFNIWSACDGHFLIRPDLDVQATQLIT